MAKVRIVDSRMFPAGDPGRRGQFDTIITYQDTTSGQVYFVTIPSADPSEEEIRKSIQEDMAKRSATIGKEFEL